MNELIEKLKKNEKPFGLMEPEEQECLKKVGKKNCLYASDMTKGWLQAPVNVDFCWGVTYAIKHDYKPERFCRIPRGMDDYSFKFCDGPGTPKECKDCPEHISNKKKPEPEFVDLEIKTYKGRLMVEWGMHAAIYPENGMCPDLTAIHYLLSLPNFEGFYLKDLSSRPNSGHGEDVEVRPEWVARYHPGVIARFSTGGDH